MSKKNLGYGVGNNSIIKNCKTPYLFVLSPDTILKKDCEKELLKAVDEKTIVFPSYDGNGMFLSMGNISATNQVGLLLIDFETPHRMRIQGKATVNQGDPLLEEFPGANLIVRVEIEKTWINCPRYIPTYKKIASSKYIPRTDGSAPIAAWKKIEEVKEVLPPADRKIVESSGETLTMEEYAKKVSDGEA